nr:reverse transcriptase domain-containing protein [Tanacetum cinerariifolium]
AILIRLGEAIPLGRPYRTCPNGPRRIITTRKRVGPLPTRRLAWRCVSHRSSYHRPSSSSSPTDSLPVHSLGLDAPGDSSKRPLHSSSHSVGPPRKRCRSLTDSVPLSTPVTGSLAPTHADLLPPRKRIDSRSVPMVDEEIVKPVGGDSSSSSSTRDGTVRPVAREYTYQDFMKCQPLNFKGTEGVVGLIRWCEKIETVFHISNCPERYQVKYASCTLLDSALTWWNLHKRTIGTDAAYALSWRKLMKLMTEVFQELTMMCTKMVLEEEDRVEMFIGGLLDYIQGNGYPMKNAKNKRRFVTNHKDNRRQQPPFKRQNNRGQNVARAYTDGNNEKRDYGGGLDIWQGIAGNYRKDCPKDKNQNRGNKAIVPNTRGKAYVLRGGDTNPGSNIVTGTFLLNDHHAYMLFDSGADRSFVSNTFSTLLDITPSALEVSYVVELADRRTSKTSIVLIGCTLGLLGYPFNIDLMPIDLGSFDVIIGMDWLAKNHAVIVCDEKIVRILYENKILIVQGNKSDEKKSMLSIISCVKSHKYMEKGCQLFLTQVTVKEHKDKSKEKRLEDVPTVRDFP